MDDTVAGLNRVVDRLEGLDRKTDQTNERLEDVVHVLDVQSDYLRALDEKVDGTNTRLDHIGTQLSEMTAALIRTLTVRAEYEALERRVRLLEAKAS
jgi:ABC-type transporter Mla subunit MlaD